MHRLIPILAYHSVDIERFQNKLALPLEVFKKQMRLLKRMRFETVSLDAIAKRFWREGLWERKVALTFDDGYADNYEKIFPVLAELGLSAAFFVTPEDVGKEGFMTWNMLRTISRTPGMEIGSHTFSHRPLADIPEKEAWESIVASKKVLEDKLGIQVHGISYPSGSFSDKVLEMVRGAGYTYGCAASHVHDRKYEGDAFLLRRIKISSSSDSDLKFLFRLSGFYHAFGRP